MRIEVGNGVVRYAPIRHGRGPHHQVVCDRCWWLYPFADERLGRELRRVSEDVALTVAEHKVILHRRASAASTAPQTEAVGGKL